MAAEEAMEAAGHAAGGHDTAGYIMHHVPAPVLAVQPTVELAKRFAQRIIGMSGGKVVYDGAPTGLNDDILRQIYGGQSWLH
mgnify:CR=1 FL=1